MIEGSPDIDFWDKMEIDATIQEINDAPRSLTAKNEATGETLTFRIDEDTEIVFDRNLDNGAAALRSDCPLPALSARGAADEPAQKIGFMPKSVRILMNSSRAHQVRMPFRH